MKDPKDPKDTNPTGGNGKGNFPSRATPPDRLSSYGASSCTSKTYKISIQKALKKNSFLE